MTCVNNIPVQIKKLVVQSILLPPKNSSPPRKKKNVDFNSNIKIGTFHSTTNPTRISTTKEAPIDMTNKFTAGMRRMKQEELTWHHTNRKNKIKNIAAHIEKLETKNQYDALTNDELTDYGTYNTPWKLDSAATGNYCGEREKVREKKKKRKGIKVVVASGGIMNQTSEGKAPFKNLPKEAEDVQIFPKMSNPLLSAGKLVKSGCKVILDSPEATVINKETNKTILKARFDATSNSWNVFPDKFIPYTFSPTTKVDKIKSLQGGLIVHLANNAYKLTTQKEIVKFYHAAAGWPVKKT